jgi:acetoin utilization deacetylase AcuC-like enzyme
MKIFYTDHFVLPLPPGHRFPMAKYALLRERVKAAGLVPPHDLLVPDAATDAELLRVHDSSYVEALTKGMLDGASVRRIGFPWSKGMVERSRRSVGATIAASRAALREGGAANLAGGTHHAYPAHGEGFCVFNDVAVAIRALQVEGLAKRFAVIDTDVHQGNGTAFIFAADPAVFTFSVHGARNYPFRKERSDLDIELPDGAGDDAWLAAIARGLASALAAGAPDVIFHIAGADAWEGDRLGRLNVSMTALAERDRLVLEAATKAGVALVLVMGGGYAARVEDTVEIHFRSVAAVAQTTRAEPEATSR